MSLHIRAYGRCTPTEVTFDDEQEVVQDNVVRPYVNADFPAQADGIVHGAWYRYEAQMSFGAGSYDGYGEWRRELARIGGYEAERAWEGFVDEAPFLELVNFADNEGVIGPRTSAKLSADFAAHEDVARGRMDDDGFRRYRKWLEAFTMAADGGFVDFR